MLSSLRSCVSSARVFPALVCSQEVRSLGNIWRTHNIIFYTLNQAHTLELHFLIHIVFITEYDQGHTFLTSLTQSLNFLPQSELYRIITS